MRKLIVLLLVVVMLAGCITMLPSLQPKDNAPAQIVIGVTTYIGVVTVMGYFVYAFAKGYIRLP